MIRSGFPRKTVLGPSALRQNGITRSGDRIQGGCMRSVKRFRKLLLAGALCLGSSALADESPLVLAARQALIKDDKLASLNLGVSVKDGVATVWGAVPDESTGRRAEERLRSVPGIHTVLGEWHVLSASDRLLDRPATGEDSTLPRPVVMAPMPMPMAPPRPKPVVIETAKPQALPIAPPPHVIASLRDPIPVLPPAPPAPSADLRQTVDRLVQQDGRYRDLKVELEGGIVLLSGRLSTWSDLWPLADALGRVPGVDRVRVAQITLANGSR